MALGIFVGLDAATLAEMKVDWLACLKAIAVAHQSYSLAGRTYTRANLREVIDLISELNFAIDPTSAGTREAVADLSHGP